MSPEIKTTYRVWRALDAETSYFGVRGRFLMLFLLMAGACLIVTLIVWTAVGDLIGMLFGAVALIACYFVIQWIQNKYTSREFERMIYSWKCIEYLKMPPVSLREHLSKTDITWK